VTSLQQLAELALRAGEVGEKTVECETSADGMCSSVSPLLPLHLYAVPAGRVFMFAPNYIGEIITLPHVRGGDPSLPVYLRVLSLSPLVFDLVNFFSKEGK
jgi:hypothetical protein